MSIKDYWKRMELNLTKNICCSRTHSTPLGLGERWTLFPLLHTGLFKFKPFGLRETGMNDSEGGQCE